MKYFKQLILLLTLFAIPLSFSAIGQHTLPVPPKSGGKTSHSNSGNSTNPGNHEYVDLGLPSGLKWATCNLGASRPSQYGSYFAWGETSSKKEFREGNSLTDGKNISNISGNPRYDAARAQWGGRWRTPTLAEMEELIRNCSWDWTIEGGTSGYRVRGRNGNSIFLPAGGSRYRTSLDFVGEFGNYWCATPDSDSDSAYFLGFNGGSPATDGTLRCYGLSIRPVID